MIKGQIDSAAFAASPRAMQSDHRAIGVTLAGKAICHHGREAIHTEPVFGWFVDRTIAVYEGFSLDVTWGTCFRLFRRGICTAPYFGL